MTPLGWLIIIYFASNGIMASLMVKNREDWLHCGLAFFFGVVMILMYGFTRIIGGKR